jgi:hypothetical protein
MFGLNKLIFGYSINENDTMHLFSSVDEVVEWMDNAGVEFDEIARGLQAMRSDHNFCSYGINKTFIFSKRK